MTLQVIGAGFGRTGTSSLKVALERLGFAPCYHMFELMSHPEHVDRWLHAGSPEPTDWEWVFDGYSARSHRARSYRAAVDWPTALFWRELAETYQDAKVILTVRDPHRWYASARDTIFRPMLEERHERPEMPEGLEAMERFEPMLRRMLRHDVFDDRMDDEDHAVAVFRRHVAEVQRTLPSERLLTFDVSEGWQPLCDFLGVDVPEGEPFPRLNDAAAIQRMFERAQAGGGLVTPFDEHE